VDDVRVLTDAAAVETALDPIRATILDALAEPASAVTVAAAIGSTRQKVNYHLKALEAHGLVELAEERVWGGITERLMRRSARHLVVAPDVLPSAAIDPDEVADQLSAAYLIAVNARSVSEVGAIAGTAATGTRLPTLTVDTVIGFAAAEDRAAFAADLQRRLPHWSPDITTTTGDRTVWPCRPIPGPRSARD
jgi:DNA-binding transcriptional ArsR family regulator